MRQDFINPALFDDSVRSNQYSAAFQSLNHPACGAWNQSCRLITPSSICWNIDVWNDDGPLT